MNQMKNNEPSSYKDNSARVFICEDEIFRKINKNYFDEYNYFIQSGLYQKLLDKNYIIEHIEASSDENSIVIKPKKVTITYPWEWCFSKLKQAALLTLKIQKIALKYNMSLKDANYFNIQFDKNNPILIDTSSFEMYKEGEPWVAFKQFCENFLAPLALYKYCDFRLKGLLVSDINGISLDLASKLLPFKSWFNLGILFNIHLHSKIQNKFQDSNRKLNISSIKKEQMQSIIEGLISCIEGLKLNKKKTQWKNYYLNNNYTECQFEQKKEVILEFKKLVNPKNVIDFGANNGEFSRLFCDCENVFSLDYDYLAVEDNYLKAKKNNEFSICPLIYDILNPSSDLGFCNIERSNLKSRLKNIDLTMALALIHHLRFTFNVPIEKISEFFSMWSKYLIIEFVEKDDIQVQKLLKNRKDIFEDYTIVNFENIFQKRYKIIKRVKITNSKRTLYLMEKND